MCRGFDGCGVWGGFHGDVIITLGNDDGGLLGQGWVG